jgi:hypothetical protein
MFPPMMKLDRHISDAALNMADLIESLFGDARPLNAQMIAVAVAEGIAAAKQNRSIKTDGDWHDSMCSLAETVRFTILAG